MTREQRTQRSKVRDTGSRRDTDWSILAQTLRYSRGLISGPASGARSATGDVAWSARRVGRRAAGAEAPGKVPRRAAGG